MQKYQKRACLLLLPILLLLAGCGIYFFFYISSRSEAGSGSHSVARIYQNGILLQEIDLSAVSEAYQFTVTGDNNCTNVVEVRRGSIGIISADCPDKLCVHQGFIDNTLLPITCLPNRLVIQLTGRSQSAGEDAPDIITY